MPNPRICVVLSVFLLASVLAGKAETAAASELDHIRDTVDSWHQAWESKDLARYLEHYSPSFDPQGTDYESWKRRKSELFQGDGLVEVEIRGLSVVVDDARASVHFHQRYRGPFHEDVGMKTLMLERLQGRWLITGERWRPAGAKGGAEDAPETAVPSARPRTGPEPDTPPDPSVGLPPPNDYSHRLFEGTDRVCIRMDRFFIPRVFSLDEDPPRVVVDVPDVRQWKGVSRKPVDGPLVKRIRSYLHRNERKLRVVLDLQPAEAYAVSQTYYRKENLFCIGVR